MKINTPVRMFITISLLTAVMFASYMIGQREGFRSGARFGADLMLDTIKNVMFGEAKSDSSVGVVTLERKIDTNYYIIGSSRILKDK